MDNLKIGVIADIHSNLNALETVLTETKKIDVDKYLCAGDIVGYGAKPNECIEKIKNLDIEIVKGNHDWAVSQDPNLDWFNPQATKAIRYTQKKITKENKKFLRNLDKTRKIKEDNEEILMAHGSPKEPLFEYIDEDRDKELEYFKEKHDFDILILGHTHIPYVQEFKNFLVVNPGSVGQPRDRDPRASFAVLDTEESDAEVKRAKYPVEETTKEIKKTNLPHQLGERLLKGI